MSGYVQVGNIEGLAKPSQAGVGGPSDINGNDEVFQGYFSANFGTLAAMKTRLTAINGALFTAAYVNGLSFNDLVYALQLVGP